MASSATINVMAKQLPPEFTDLATVARQGEKSAVTVVGAVIHWMSPAQSRGSDMQMTFTIRDNSTLTNGLRIKYFRKRAEDFPAIRNHGDIVLLRNLRISKYQKELLGLASYQTEYIVFPVESIVSPDFRDKYAVQRNFLKHSKSSGGPLPNIHEQQWVISLNAYLKGLGEHMKSTAQSPAVQDTPGAKMLPTSAQNLPPTSAQVFSKSDKFSLIKNVNGGDRNGGNRLGNFYDLAGEVVKMFFNISLGILDLYVTDYTVNSMLPDLKAANFEEGGQAANKGPTGKMTLHIELYPPHATWTHQNIKEGDFISVRNVRIKWNQRGLGTELEGNVWTDKTYPDRVNVSLMADTNPHYEGIQARKSSYEQKVLSKESKITKREKKKPNKGNKRRKLTNDDSTGGGSPNQSDQENELHVEDRTENVEDRKEKSTSLNGDPHDIHKEDLAVTSKKLNPNVICLHPKVPLSTLDEIMNNPNRWVTTSSGEKYEAPFVNVKHHARLRVIDYFPHQLKEFSCLVPHDDNPDEFIWEWRFWLVLKAGDSDEADVGAINVEVRDNDAEDLLQIVACDLSKDSQRLQELEQTLFLLWGELAEQKDKFLCSHPNIQPDADFSTTKYNIQTDNRAFDTCIHEYGKPITVNREGEAAGTETRYFRFLRMFGTRIKL